MDLEIDVECRDCGLFFKTSLGMMEHGKPLKCAFCNSVALELRGDYLLYGDEEPEVFDHAVEDQALRRKIR